MEVNTPVRTNLSKAEHEALKNVKTTKQSSIHEKQRQDIAEFMAIRNKAASEFKKKLFAQAMHVAGVDAAELQKRQARDSETVSAFLIQQKQKIVEQATEINKRNEMVITERLSRRHRINTANRMQQQSIVLTLDTAAEILLSGTGTTSIAANNNLAFTQASVSSGGYLGGPLEGDLVTVDWLFVWTPPRDGLLDVVSFLTMNGLSSLSTNSTCDGGSSSSNVSGSITLSQGNMKDSSSTDIFDMQVSSSWGDSLGAVNIFTLDETDTVGYRPTQFPVLAEIPIVITVSASLYTLVNNGEAVLDFMSGDFRLNVPYAFLQLI